MRPTGAVDFETYAIGPRPAYPPVPVGVALKCRCCPELKRGRYLAWGHPDGNNATKAEGLRHLKTFARDHRVLCHHAGFDLDVAETHCGLQWPTEHDDTLLLAFLVDPDAGSLSLKPLAERYLGEPPTERDALREWILDHISAATEKTWGAYIAFAPAAIVGPYAIGDVHRTLKLYNFFLKDVKKEERFWTAYQRELKVTRVLIKMERRGLPVAVARLRRDGAKYQAALEELERALCKRLKTKWAPDMAWSGPNFAELLLASKLVKDLPLTEKGNLSTSAESLAEVMPKDLAKEFEVRAQIATCLGTFMKPWLAQGEANDGVMYARFNQVRNSDEWGKKVGARTGRLSMTPNLQNVIRSDKDPRVPVLRDYVVPGRFYKAFAARDISQQELRLLAIYEDGPFKQSYIQNPRQDAHELVRSLIKATTGVELERRPVKDLNFGLIYGQGLALTAEKMGIPRDEARKLRAAHAASLPGVPELQDLLTERARANQPIWTWGGRRYFCEPPVFRNSRRMSFEYKMLNRLIQGSAADCTKEWMIRYDALPIACDNPLLLQIHDDLMTGVTGDSMKVLAGLRDSLLDIPFEIPMFSEGKLGRVSWHQMAKVKD